MQVETVVFVHTIKIATLVFENLYETIVRFFLDNRTSIVSQTITTLFAQEKKLKTIFYIKFLAIKK